MINEIPCDKACISSNDNKNIDTIAENFLGSKLGSTVLSPSPAGLCQKAKSDFALYSQNGCDGLTGKNQCERGCVSKKT